LIIDEIKGRKVAKEMGISVTVHLVCWLQPKTKDIYRVLNHS